MLPKWETLPKSEMLPSWSMLQLGYTSIFSVGNPILALKPFQSRSTSKLETHLAGKPFLAWKHLSSWENFPAGKSKYVEFHPPFGEEFLHLNMTILKKVNIFW